MIHINTVLGGDFSLRKAERRGCIIPLLCIKRGGKKKKKGVALRLTKEGGSGEFPGTCWGAKFQREKINNNHLLLLKRGGRKWDRGRRGRLRSPHWLNGEAKQGMAEIFTSLLRAENLRKRVSHLFYQFSRYTLKRKRKRIEPHLRRFRKDAVTCASATCRERERVAIYPSARRGGTKRCQVLLSFLQKREDNTAPIEGEKKESNFLIFPLFGGSHSLWYLGKEVEDHQCPLLSIKWLSAVVPRTRPKPGALRPRKGGRAIQNKYRIIREQRGGKKRGRRRIVSDRACPLRRPPCTNSRGQGKRGRPVSYSCREKGEKNYLTPSRCLRSPILSEDVTYRNGGAHAFLLSRSGKGRRGACSSSNVAGDIRTGV